MEGAERKGGGGICDLLMGYENQPVCEPDSFYGYPAINRRVAPDCLSVTIKALEGKDRPSVHGGRKVEFYFTSIYPW